MPGCHLQGLRPLQLFESGCLQCSVYIKYFSVLYKLVVAISKLLEPSFYKGWNEIFLTLTCLGFGFFLLQVGWASRADRELICWCCLGTDTALPMNSCPAAPTWHSLGMPKIVPKPEVPKSLEEDHIFWAELMETLFKRIQWKKRRTRITDWEIGTKLVFFGFFYRILFSITLISPN